MYVSKPDLIPSQLRGLSAPHGGGGHHGGGGGGGFHHHGGGGGFFPGFFPGVLPLYYEAGPMVATYSLDPGEWTSEGMTFGTPGVSPGLPAGAIRSKTYGPWKYNARAKAWQLVGSGSNAGAVPTNYVRTLSGLGRRIRPRRVLGDVCTIDPQTGLRICMPGASSVPVPTPAPTPAPVARAPVPGPATTVTVATQTPQQIAKAIGYTSSFNWSSSTMRCGQEFDSNGNLVGSFCRQYGISPTDPKNTVNRKPNKVWANGVLVGVLQQLLYEYQAGKRAGGSSWPPAAPAAAILRTVPVAAAPAILPTVAAGAVQAGQAVVIGTCSGGPASGAACAQNADCGPNGLCNTGGLSVVPVTSPTGAQLPQYVAAAPAIAAAAVPSTISTSSLLLYGGIGLAAYFLFFRR